MPKSNYKRQPLDKAGAHFRAPASAVSAYAPLPPALQKRNVARKNLFLRLAAPAAGNNLAAVINVPSGFAFEPIMLQQNFLADATVATRSLNLSIQQAVALPPFSLIFNPPFTVLANQTGYWIWGKNTITSLTSANDGLTKMTPLPDTFMLPWDFTVLITVTNLQAGDQLAGLILNYNLIPQ